MRLRREWGVQTRIKPEWLNHNGIPRLQSVWKQIGQWYDSREYAEMIAGPILDPSIEARIITRVISDVEEVTDGSSAQDSTPEDKVQEGVHEVRR